MKFLLKSFGILVMWFVLKEAVVSLFATYVLYIFICYVGFIYIYIYLSLSLKWCSQYFWSIQQYMHNMMQYCCPDYIYCINTWTTYVEFVFVMLNLDIPDASILVICCDLSQPAPHPTIQLQQTFLFTSTCPCFIPSVMEVYGHHHENTL